VRYSPSTSAFLSQIQQTSNQRHGDQEKLQGDIGQRRQASCDTTPELSLKSPQSPNTASFSRCRDSSKGRRCNRARVANNFAGKAVTGVHGQAVANGVESVRLFYFLVKLTIPSKTLSFSILTQPPNYQIANFSRVYAQICEYLKGDPVFNTERTEQKMLYVDIVATSELLSFF
jgi:hypothetical protein